MILELINKLNIQNISSREMSLYSEVDKIFNGGETTPLNEFINNMCNARSSDGMLYARLEKRLENLLLTKEHNEDESMKIRVLLEAMEEHSKEEMDNFKDLIDSSISLGIACGFNYKFTPAANMKFTTVEEIIEFVQNQELKSLVEFYVLYKIFSETDILDEFEDEKILFLVLQAMGRELDHYEDLLSYTNTTPRILEFLETIRNIINDGF